MKNPRDEPICSKEEAGDRETRRGSGVFGRCAVARWFAFQKLPISREQCFDSSGAFQYTSHEASHRIGSYGMGNGLTGGKARQIRVTQMSWIGCRDLVITGGHRYI